MAYKFIILQTIVAGLLGAAYLSGVLNPVLIADHYYAMPVLAGLVVVNLGMVFIRAQEAAEWLSDMLPVVGLVFTVYAVLSVLWGLQGISDIDSHRLQIFTDIGQALVANLVGMFGYAWVRLSMRVCK